MNALWYFMPLFAAQRARFLRATLLSLVTLSTGVALLGTSGWFLTAAALTTAGAAFNLFGPSALVRGLSFMRILSRYGEKTVGHNATLALLSDIRRWLFVALFPILPLRNSLLGRGELIGRLVADVDALDVAFLVAIGPITTAIVACVAMTVGLAITLPTAALPYAACYFGAVVVVPLGLVWLTLRVGNQQIRASGTLRSAIVDSVDSHRDLVLFGAIPSAAASVAQAAMDLSRAKRRLGIFGAIAAGLVQMLAGATMVIVLAVGLSALELHTIDPAILVGALLAVIASFEAAMPLVRGASRMSSAVAAAGRLKSLAQTPVAIRSPVHPVAVSAGGRLEFSKVSFGYDSAHLVFSDVSFAIEDGARVALVGPSGAGKSTLAQLAVRLQDPIAGAIRLNGLDLRRFDLADLRSRVSVMTQDAPVFLDSVRNNLLIGRPNASEAELWDVLGHVRLDTLVNTLPDGLDSFVGEAGSSLSAGEGRRLCLARTLLSKARVIILDEPTRGLDEAAAAAFFAELPGLVAGRTLLVITHATTLATGFDGVFKVEGGGVTPQVLP